MSAARRRDPAEIRGHRRQQIADRIENEHLGIYEPDDDVRTREQNHPKGPQR